MSTVHQNTTVKLYNAQALVGSGLHEIPIALISSRVGMQCKHQHTTTHGINSISDISIIHGTIE